MVRTLNIYGAWPLLTAPTLFLYQPDLCYYHQITLIRLLIPYFSLLRIIVIELKIQLG